MTEQSNFTAEDRDALIQRTIELHTLHPTKTLSNNMKVGPEMFIFIKGIRGDLIHVATFTSSLIGRDFFDNSDFNIGGSCYGAIAAFYDGFGEPKFLEHTRDEDAAVRRRKWG